MIVLAEIDTNLAAGFSAVTFFTVLRFNGLAIMTIVVVVIHVSVRRRILHGISMVRTDFCHLLPILSSLRKKR